MSAVKQSYEEFSWRTFWVCQTTNWPSLFLFSVISLSLSKFRRIFAIFLQFILSKILSYLISKNYINKELYRLCAAKQMFLGHHSGPSWVWMWKNSKDLAWFRNVSRNRKYDNVMVPWLTVQLSELWDALARWKFWVKLLSKDLFMGPVREKSDLNAKD